MHSESLTATWGKSVKNSCLTCSSRNIFRALDVMHHTRSSLKSLPLNCHSSCLIPSGTCFSRDFVSVLAGDEICFMRIHCESWATSIKFAKGSALCSNTKWKLLSHVLSHSLQTHGLYSPWNSPGQNIEVGSLSLLQGIFPTQGSNSGLPHCRRILYQLNYQRSTGGNPKKLKMLYLRVWFLGWHLSPIYVTVKVLSPNKPTPDAWTERKKN